MVDFLKLKRQKWAEASRKYRAKHPERQASADARKYSNKADIIKARVRAYKYADKRRAMLDDAKKRARTRGLDFSLTIENVQWPEFCPIFGTKFDYTRGKGRAKDTTPSLDRKDPLKGYTPDNVCVISWLANRIKTNATPEQVHAVAVWLKEQQWPDSLT